MGFRSFVTLELFLDVNGWTFNADDASCITAIEDLAAGSPTEVEFSTWVRNHLARAGSV